MIALCNCCYSATGAYPKSNLNLVIFVLPFFFFRALLHSWIKMATNFSQVTLTQDNTGEWEFTPKNSNKNSNKRRRHATSSSSNYSPQEFENASNKTKLAMIFEEISDVKADQASLHELLINTNQQLKARFDPINGISSVTNQHSALLKTLAYKSIDIEARSRRNNLIFRGLKESYHENCLDIVLDFLCNTVQLDTRGIVITRAHRLGAYKSGQRYARPIIVNFMNYNDVENIMANAKTLKFVPGFSIYRDLPKEIVDARKRLWGLYKDTQKNNPNSNVRIVYPAKLMCGSHVIRDEFPDWHTFLHRSRIVEFSILEPLSPDGVAMDTTAQPVSSAAKDVEVETSETPNPTQCLRNTKNDDVAVSEPQRDQESDSGPSLFRNTVGVGKDASSSKSQKPQVAETGKKGSHTSRSTTRRRSQSVSTNNRTRTKMPSPNDVSESASQPGTVPSDQPCSPAKDSG